MDPELARERYLSLKSFADSHGERLCEHAGCHAPATHKAPQSPDRIHDHYWFCLAHVREYNARWDYFAGKSERDIRDFERANACWHRPTWKINGQGGKTSGVTGPDDLHIHDPLDLFGLAGAQFRETWADNRRHFDPDGLTPLTSGDRKALSELGLDASATKDDIRKAYKALVKRYHPDAGGADASASRFRRINEAYRHLASTWRQTNAAP